MAQQTYDPDREEERLFDKPGTPDKDPEDVVFGSNARTSEGVQSSKSVTGYIYGSGDQVGFTEQPDGVDLMRKRGEAGTQYQQTDSPQEGVNE